MITLHPGEKNSTTVLRRLQQNTNTFDLKSEMKEPEYVV